MTTIASLLSDADRQPKDVTSASALEAELLLAFVLNKPRSFLRAWPSYGVTDAECQLFNQYLQRRCQGEPMAYLTGQREFWSLPFTVTPDTLIPRPETELLVEHALGLFPANQAIQVADLGTGSGAIAIALAHERPAWALHAVDVSDSALRIASNSAQKLGIKNTSFYSGSWCTALPCCKLDMIVSNPPYIAEAEWGEYAAGLSFEPRQALVSGWDGLEAIRAISKGARNCLKPGGYLLVEHGFSQAADVRAIFAADDYRSIYSVSDIAGQERITIGNILL